MNVDSGVHAFGERGQLYRLPAIDLQQGIVGLWRPSGRNRHHRLCIPIEPHDGLREEVIIGASPQALTVEPRAVGRPMREKLSVKIVFRQMYLTAIGF
jgi:hypothetical protein